MRAHIIEKDKVVNTIMVDSLDFMPNLINAAMGGALGDLWDGKTFRKPLPTAEALAIIAEAEVEEVKARLREIDIASIRSIREFVTAKFASDPLLPKDKDGKAILGAYDSLAAAEREKLKPKA